MRPTNGFNTNKHKGDRQEVPPLWIQMLANKTDNKWHIFLFLHSFFLIMVGWHWCSFLWDSIVIIVSKLFIVIWLSLFLHYNLLGTFVRCCLIYLKRLTNFFLVKSQLHSKHLVSMSLDWATPIGVILILKSTCMEKRKEILK